MLARTEEEGEAQEATRTALHAAAAAAAAARRLAAREA